MNQRVGVDHLERAGIVHRVVDGAADRLARCQREDRTQPLAAIEQAIAHRLEQPRLQAVMLTDGGRERALDKRRAIL